MLRKMDSIYYKTALRPGPIEGFSAFFMGPHLGSGWFGLGDDGIMGDEDLLAN